jgi:hypothetical protein
MPTRRVRLDLPPLHGLNSPTAASLGCCIAGFVWTRAAGFRSDSRAAGFVWISPLTGSFAPRIRSARWVRSFRRVLRLRGALVPLGPFVRLAGLLRWARPLGVGGAGQEPAVSAVRRLRAAPRPILFEAVDGMATTSRGSPEPDERTGPRGRLGHKAGDTCISMPTRGPNRASPALGRVHSHRHTRPANPFLQNRGGPIRWFGFSAPWLCSASRTRRPGLSGSDSTWES